MYESVKCMFNLNNKLVFKSLKCQIIVEYYNILHIIIVYYRVPNIHVSLNKNAARLFGSPECVN